MAEGFVKASGGRLAITSKPGRGATIQLCLPRTERREKVEVQKHRPVRARRRRPCPAHGGRPSFVTRPGRPDAARALGYQVSARGRWPRSCGAPGGGGGGSVAHDQRGRCRGGMNGRQLADQASCWVPSWRCCSPPATPTTPSVARDARAPGDASFPKPYRRAKLAEPSPGPLWPEGSAKSYALAFSSALGSSPGL